MMMMNRERVKGFLLQANIYPAAGAIGVPHEVPPWRVGQNIIFEPPSDRLLDH